MMKQYSIQDILESLKTPQMTHTYRAFKYKSDAIKKAQVRSWCAIQKNEIHPHNGIFVKYDGIGIKINTHQDLWKSNYFPKWFICRWA